MPSFSHSGNAGDIIYSLPCIISICEQRNEKADLYLKINKRTNYHMQHPLVNVTLNRDFAEKLIPLLKRQPWCNSCKIWDQEKIEFDLDLARSVFPCLLTRSYFYTYFSNYDLSTPWLWVDPDERCAGKIVINRTFRYRIPNLTFNQLRGQSVVFVGLKDEYEDFSRRLPGCEWIKASDFLELARIIKGCGIFIGNQSFAYSLAEAMKVKPRILETYQKDMNVVPSGLQAYDFLSPLGFETIMQHLINVAFDEDYYLENNPDVAKSIETTGWPKSGYIHYLEHGSHENRKFRYVKS